MPYSCRHGKKYRPDHRLWLLPVATMLTLLLLAQGEARAAYYSFTTPTATAFDAAATNVVWEQTCTNNNINDDQQLVNIGFTFNFGGVDYTQVRILSNGALHFGANQNFQTDSSNEALPITGVGGGPCAESAADRVVAPYWDNLRPDNGGTVRYGTLGGAPNRRFAVSWAGVPKGVGTSYTFQAILYENGAIRFRYGAGDADGASATIGVEVSDTDYTQFSVNTASVSTANDILFTPYHFAISHDGSNNRCAPEPVTISYHSNSSDAVVPGYTGTINLSTSTVHGDWSVITGAGILINSGNGTATYAFAAGDSGVVTLGLADTFNETLSINITDGSSVELPAEDPNLTFSNLLNPNTYLDNFNARLYSNNNGTLNWTGNWAEVGENDGPINGDEQVVTDPSVGGNYRLRLQDNDNGGEGVERQADLTTLTAATLSFDYRRAGLDNANDYVAISVYNNTTSTWDELGRLTGGPVTDAAYLSTSYDLTGYIAVNTRIRFRTSNNMGSGDQIYFDNIQIFDPTTVACGGVDHYSISHDGTAINCQAEPVTISAHDAGHGVITSHTGTINLSTDTGHGDWSVITGTPANLVNSGGGSATYTFAAANNGVVVLGLKDTFVESVNLHVTNGTSTENTGSALAAEDLPLDFARAGFNFLGASIADNITTQIGGKASSVAPGNQVLELQAIKTSDSTGACETALLGPNTIDLAFECRDPTTCTANQASISGTAIAANNNGAVASYTGVSLNFAASRATFTLTYPEVGRLRLHARYNIPLGGGGPSGNLMLGNSNEFVVRPFGFQVTAAGNPAVSGPGGAVYTSAGTPFNATVRAVLWQAGDDANLDGIPEGHNDTDPANNANLADNSAALNFGQEATPETVALSSMLGLPAPTLPLTANDPGLAGTTTVSGFTNGSATSAVRFDEVGSIEIAAALSDASYLGAGPVLGRSGVVGRFKPHHFRVVPAPDPPTLADACLSGSFTYLGQPFTYTAAPVLTLTAENQGNATTRNYDCDGFWKLSEPYALAYTYTDGAGAGPTLTPNNGSASPPVTVPTATADCNGSVSLTISDNFTYSRPALTSPIIPFPASINLAATAAQFTDSDGVCFDTGSGCQGLSRNGITGATLRLGQTITSNAYGPETATITEPLLLPVTIQYYDNTAHWVTSSNDNCSQFTYLITPDGSITVNSSPASPVTTTSGRGNLRLWPTADPGAAGGQVQIDYTLPSWLGPNAQAEAFFGIYRGNDRIINWRELVR